MIIWVIFLFLSFYSIKLYYHLSFVSYLSLVHIATEMNLHTKNLLKALSPETVKDMVRNELQTYDADKTGRTDYALESSGFIQQSILI